VKERPAVTVSPADGAATVWVKVREFGVLPNLGGIVEPTGIAVLSLWVTVAVVDQSLVTVQVTTEAPVAVVQTLAPETFA